MGVGRGAGVKFSATEVVFSVSSGKNQILPLLGPLEKIRENLLVSGKILPTPMIATKFSV